MLTQEVQDRYFALLDSELVPATGCTEPIAIAYGAALLREVLGNEPEEVLAEISGNIIKNVKSVIVPNTGGRKGIETAIAAGIVAGDPKAKLQVIGSVPAEKHEAIGRYKQNTPIKIVCPETPHLLDITLTGKHGNDSATVRIVDAHTNVVLKKKNDTVLFEKEVKPVVTDGETQADFLNVKDIVEFAAIADIDRLSAVLEPQIQCNTAISEEGVKGNWGSNIGATLLSDYADDIKTEAKAYAAAGADARMSGCEMPVVIVSGSGNQGITASVPVVRYAKHMGATKEQLYRALAVSDLVTLHEKTGIGRLSAYCGAISAGVGAGAGIAYLNGADANLIGHTIENGIAILSGTICDGAKPSCASKIAAAVEAGILGYRMAVHDKNFLPGDGIVADNGVEETIVNVGQLARLGMAQTDRTILEIMTGGNSKK